MSWAVTARVVRPLIESADQRSRLWPNCLMLNQSQSSHVAKSIKKPKRARPCHWTYRPRSQVERRIVNIQYIDRVLLGAPGRTTSNKNLLPGNLRFVFRFAFRFAFRFVSFRFAESTPLGANTCHGVCRRPPFDPLEGQ